MKTLPRFTLGTGDRFGRQGVAQLTAIHDATLQGVPVHPVWNKSNREHSLIGTKPPSLREEADAAVRALGWTKPYFVDADHIGLQTVEAFLPCCDFFTIDVADLTGQPAPEEKLRAFVHRHAKLVGSHTLPNLDFPLLIDRADLEAAASKFLSAMEEAGRIHRHIAAAKPDGDFAIEVSIDETDTPQSPAELLAILAMLADEGVPAQTIAPKFTGRFNKGVDYSGDLHAFEREFDADLAVIALAIDLFGLPRTLKISVHSGSDKFSIYPAIRRLVEKHNAGLHLKTAGTTWLEEVAGLAESGGEGLRIAKDIYAAALPRAVDLIQPYAPVVDIDPATLPADSEVEAWTAGEFVGRLEHNQSSPLYDPQFRQFLHVSFRVAAEMGARFTDALEANAAIVNRRVRANLLDKHILPLFPKT
jgi:tagaturonate epimerase